MRKRRDVVEVLVKDREVLERYDLDCFCVLAFARVKTERE